MFTFEANIALSYIIDIFKHALTTTPLNSVRTPLGFIDLPSYDWDCVCVCVKQFAHELYRPCKLYNTAVLLQIQGHCTRHGNESYGFRYIVPSILWGRQRYCHDPEIDLLLTLSRNTIFYIIVEEILYNIVVFGEVGRKSREHIFFMLSHFYFMWTSFYVNYF